MKLIPSPTRINVMYFTSKDHKGNVFVVDKESLTVTSSTHSTLVTTDETIVSTFDCKWRAKNKDINTDFVDCIFATHGPYIFRVQLQENPAIGLVEVTNSPLKVPYEMFYDNTAIRITFNDNYFAILSTSVSAGKHRILIYKFSKNRGVTSYLWSGIKLDEHSKRPLQDLDLLLEPDDTLIFATNSFEQSGVVTLAKSVSLKEAQIEVKNADISQLKKFRIKFNDNQGDIPQSFIPISDLFLHKDEQSNQIGFKSTSWVHWVVISTFALIIYGLLLYGWKFEKDRRQKLREEVLCNNLGDELRV